MKMKTIVTWFAGILSAATVAAAAGTVGSDQTAASPAKEKEFKGKVDYVDDREHTLTVRGILEHRTFDLGNNCAIARWDNTAGNIDDLRPGQKVIVGYRDVDGVMAADRVEQVAMRHTGIVKVMEPESRRLVLRIWERDNTFVLAADCKVVLHDKDDAAPADIKPGDHVTVVYETPYGGDVVRQIAQTSVRFTGSVVAIDLPHRLVSADGLFGVKQFNLADNCSIVMDGRINASMTSLRPGARLTFSYDEVNGVNVANRIAPAESEHMAATAQANP